MRITTSVVDDKTDNNDKYSDTRNMIVILITKSSTISMVMITISLQMTITMITHPVRRISGHRNMTED